MIRGHSALLRQPGPVTAVYKALQQIPVEGWGQQGNGDTGSNYTRYTGRITLTCDFVLEVVGINFYAAQNYKVAFVDGTGSSPGDLVVIDAAFAATGGRAFDLITPSAPIYLAKGVHYLSHLGASTKVTANLTDNSVTINEYLTLSGSYFNGSNSTSWTPGFVLFGKRMT